MDHDEHFAKANAVLAGEQPAKPGNFYRLRPEPHVEALRFLGVDGGLPIFEGIDAADVPEWVAIALAKPEGAIGAAWIDYQPTRSDPLGQQETLVIGTYQGNLGFTPGDYLARAPRGQVRCYPEHWFSATYEPA